VFCHFVGCVGPKDKSASAGSGTLHCPVSKAQNVWYTQLKKKYILELGDSLALPNFFQSYLKGNAVSLLRMVTGKGKYESK